MHTMGTCKGYLLFAVSAMLIGKAWAGGQAVDGLSLRLSPQSKVPCLSRAFQIWDWPDPSFFKDLKQVKSKLGTRQYRRGRDLVENFPDSTRITIEFWQGRPEFACTALPPFDPAKVKFHLEWKHDAQIVPAKGSFFISEESQQPWCEDKCSWHWTYELRIDSQNVPLQDNLIIRIEAEDGTRLAEYVGELDTLPQPSLSVPAAH